MKVPSRAAAAICLMTSVLALGSCGGDKPAAAPTGVPRPLGRVDERALTATKLRTFCRSCHGVGTLRFIQNDDDEQLWKYIRETNVPGTTRLWLDSIIDVLSWPSDAPPPFDELKDPATSRDWMPKGVKRVQLADDVVESESTRHLMLRALEAERQ